VGDRLAVAKDAEAPQELDARARWYGHT
jgi:hypothetical protein